MARELGLLLALAGAGLGAPVQGVQGQAPAVRIGLYCSGGASHCQATAPTCCEPQPEYLATLTVAARMAFGAAGFTIANMTAADVGALEPSALDVAVFPGGSGNGQAAAVGPAGLVALRKFVAAGKGYIGTCGGSFLGLQHVGFYLPPKHAPCGDVSKADKLLQPHCTPLTQEPFDRGDGDVQVEFTQAVSSDTFSICAPSVSLTPKVSLFQGLEQLSLPPAQFSGNVTIFYGQGPIVKGDAFPPFVKQLAFYRSEIHSRHTANTTGEMLNTPAITTLDGYSTSGPSGQGQGGRVVLNSPHPELTKPPIPAIYAGELSWVLRRRGWITPLVPGA